VLWAEPKQIDGHKFVPFWLSLSSTGRLSHWCLHERRMYVTQRELDMCCVIWCTVVAIPDVPVVKVQRREHRT